MPTTKLVEGKDLAIIKSVIQSIDYGRTSTYRSQLEAFEIEAQACGREREEGRRVLYDVFDLNSDPPVYERLIRHNGYETRYDVDDFVNPEDFRYRAPNYALAFTDPTHPTVKPEYRKAYVILNGGYVLAIVFAEYDAYSEQDAIDEAVDKGKLDGLKITEEELKEYETGERTDVGSEHCPEGYPVYDERVAHFGNASEPFDQESLDLWVVDAAQFAEDPALMTPDRVMDYLKEQAEEAHRIYKETPLDEPAEPGKDRDRKWLDAYRNDDDWQDAVTLAKFAQSR